MTKQNNPSKGPSYNTQQTHMLQVAAEHRMDGSNAVEYWRRSNVASPADRQQHRLWRGPQHEMQQHWSDCILDTATSSQLSITSSPQCKTHDAPNVLRNNIPWNIVQSAKPPPQRISKYSKTIDVNVAVYLCLVLSWTQINHFLTNQDHCASCHL